MAAEHPDFVVNVGDSIEGGNDGNAETEWHELNALRLPFQRYLLYFTPGNHDIWSPKSAAAYQKATGRPLHYSFDFRQAHFTILDNSQSEQLADAELHFLQSDLIAHASQPVKFVFFHRPSWILPVLLRNPDFPLHQLARKFGVQYVICGHIHQMLHFELDGITYLSMPSAGGHLRNPKTYNKGWFFGQTIVTVDGNKISMSIQELDAPFGRGRTTSPEDWGAAGLQEKSAQQVF